MLSFNHEKYISEAIASVLAQTFEDFELVVVDDGSTDGSIERIKSFLDPRIKLFALERNVGASAAFNFGLDRCEGEWICNIDSDDFIDPSKTEVCLREASRRGDVDIFGTWVKAVDESGGTNSRTLAVESVVNQEKDLNLLSAWVVENLLCRSSTMVRRSVYEKVGYSDPTMTYEADYELWTRALRLGMNFFTIRAPLTYMRIHGRQLSHSNPEKALEEMVYALSRNAVPLAVSRGLYPEWNKLVEWFCSNQNRWAFSPPWVIRAADSLIVPTIFDSFATYQDSLRTHVESTQLIGLFVVAAKPRNPCMTRDSRELLRAIHSFARGGGKSWRQGIISLRDGHLDRVLLFLFSAVTRFFIACYNAFAHLRRFARREAGGAN
jgi:GT2 family glycosyltransferase